MRCSLFEHFGEHRRVEVGAEGKIGLGAFHLRADGVAILLQHFYAGTGNGVHGTHLKYGYAQAPSCNLPASVLLPES